MLEHGQGDESGEQEDHGHEVEGEHDPFGEGVGDLSTEEEENGCDEEGPDRAEDEEADLGG